jgi:hypothetical protein
MMDTREVPASKLRELNAALEKTAWKAFRAELSPTDDLYPGAKIDSPIVPGQNHQPTLSRQ